MKTIICFVSSYKIDSEPACKLVAGLRERGVEVDHSPISPEKGNDPRWRDWYTDGCAKSISKCDAFVIVIDKAWDSSTWMAHEAWCAMHDPERSRTPVCFYWNPMDIRPTAAGMVGYLKERLPNDPEKAANVLISKIANG